MRKKGFTLIELLAVIVILAIIAVIASPIIVGIIDDSRLKGKVNSVNGLMEAVNITYTKSSLTTTPLSLPITANINNGIITATDGTNSVEVEYSGEKPVSGTIKIDLDGNLTAINVKYSDNYICSMGLGDSSCNNKRRIFEGMVKDPNETSLPDNEARYIFVGETPSNLIKLKENGTEQDYRIVSVEKDGTIKVIRQDNVKAMAYDSRSGSGTEADPYTNLRRNENNSYCNYANSYDNYYGCNWYGKATGIINGVSNVSVNTNSEINTYLNTTYYNTLDDSVKKNVVNHFFKLTPSSYIGDWAGGRGQSSSSLYTSGLTSMTWEGKIGLLELRDWFNASSNSYGEGHSCVPDKEDGTGGGYYKETNPPTYTCSQLNYLNNGSHWWTMSPSASIQYGVWYVDSSGCMSNYYAYSTSLGARPVFYLSSNTELTGNGGSGIDAYRIKE